MSERHDTDDDWKARVRRDVKRRFQAQDMAWKILVQLVGKEEASALVWLVDPVADMVLMPLQDQVGAARSPVERKWLAEQNEKGQQACADLTDVLRNPYVRSQLFNDWPDDRRGEFHEAIATVLHHLQTMGQTFEHAGARLRGKPGPGRIGLTYHDRSPEWCCAVCATLIWRHARSELPKPGAQGPQRLCAALWQAAGGKGQPDWRHHMEFALPYFSEDQSVDRNGGRRWFENAERHFNEMAERYRRQQDETG
jgi:hypothetical protein